MAREALPEGRGVPTEIQYCASDYTDGHAELMALARRLEREAVTRDNDAFQVETLAGSERAVALNLPLLTREGSLGMLAVAVPAEQAIPSLDGVTLESFLDRVALAMENASVHQRLLMADEIKSNFLANVSHELRTPLTSIRSFSELLLSYDDPEVRQEFTRVINSESERLTRLVNDLLDITRIESGEIEWKFERVDVRALLEEAVRAHAPLIQSENLAFETDVCPDVPPVHGDRDRLQQVIGNLLGNAVKFTERGSIRLGARQFGDEVRLTVADAGIGIAPEDQERIFEKFQQVGAVLTDKPTGTGLGLAICRDIVQHHQGRIWVESEHGAGSTFTVALPAVVDRLAGPPDGHAGAHELGHDNRAVDVARVPPGD